MKITVQVSEADLADMGAMPDELEDAVRLAIESGLNIDGDTLYINDAIVQVVVAEP